MNKLLLIFIGIFLIGLTSAMPVFTLDVNCHTNYGFIACPTEITNNLNRDLTATLTYEISLPDEEVSCDNFTRQNPNFIRHWWFSPDTMRTEDFIFSCNEKNGKVSYKNTANYVSQREYFVPFASFHLINNSRLEDYEVNTNIKYKKTNPIYEIMRSVLLR